jgi:hypothetical protein
MARDGGQPRHDHGYLRSQVITESDLLESLRNRRGAEPSHLAAGLGSVTVLSCPRLRTVWPVRREGQDLMSVIRNDRNRGCSC